MRRLLLIALMALPPLTVATSVWAQEATPKADEPTTNAKEAEKEEQEPPLQYKWLNFLILAAGIGYLIVAKGMPALTERGQEIERSLKAAEQIKTDAAAEEAAIDRKMAGLKAEIESMRTSAKQEMDAERQRLSAETTSLVAKLQANAESEISTLAKQAQIALRAKASDLAMGLARQKVTASMNSQTDTGLVASFVNDLKKIQEARN